MFQNNFVTGNKIQLVSKINGRALQVTHPATGGPIVYGNGDLGPDARNGTFFQKIQQMLSINENYLGFQFPLLAK